MNWSRIALSLLGTMSGTSCSLMLDKSVIQCQSDTDCAHFGHTVCDVRHHVCTATADGGAGARDAATDAADPCVGPGNCFACTPVSESEILSHCTDGVCVPFDNRRWTLRGSDGSLRPLPE